MQDIPQPSSSPYAVGETVRIYVGKDDHDVRFHNRTGVITERFEDELDLETGRELDRYYYRVRLQDEDLSVDFRHHDLIPVAD